MTRGCLGATSKRSDSQHEDSRIPYEKEKTGRPSIMHLVYCVLCIYWARVDARREEQRQPVVCKGGRASETPFLPYRRSCGTRVRHHAARQHIVYARSQYSSPPILERPAPQSFWTTTYRGRSLCGCNCRLVYFVATLLAPRYTPPGHTSECAVGPPSSSNVPGQLQRLSSWSATSARVTPSRNLDSS